MPLLQEHCKKTSERNKREYQILKEQHGERFLRRQVCRAIKCLCKSVESTGKIFGEVHLITITNRTIIKSAYGIIEQERRIRMPSRRGKVCVFQPNAPIA